MHREIIWSRFAEDQLDSIFKYYKERAGERVATKIIRGLINEPEKLLDEPFIGQIEELLKTRKESYRYLMSRSYKIIYSVDQTEGVIKIADVFDTRQNPEKIKRTE